MTTPEPADTSTFDTAVAPWQRWRESPWGRLRYTVAHANLVRHLGEAVGGPLHVLDLGGGDGGDALPLATMGHQVTIVDQAAGMLATAAQRADAHGCAERVHCVQADLHKLPPNVLEQDYDLVLCHNVLPYVNDVAALVVAATTPLRSAGLLSIMGVNRHSEPLRLAVRDADPTAAAAALTTDHSHSVTFGSSMRLYTAEEIGSTLTRHGCTVVGHYGIRGICDYITDDERKYDSDFFADLERLELAVADRFPYKHVARIFHLIAQHDERERPE